MKYTTNNNNNKPNVVEPNSITYIIKGDELWALTENKRYLIISSTNKKAISEIPKVLDLPETPKTQNGLKIKLSGRLKGVRMARKYEESVGVGLRTQSIEWAIEEEKRQIYTKWGTIGLKVSRGGGKER